jgi:hypothetical protein
MMFNLIKYGTAAAIFLGIYTLAAVALWGTAWFVAPAGKRVAFRQAALVAVIMIPIDLGLPYVLGEFPYTALLDFAIVTLFVAIIVRIPVWRSLLAAGAYFAALLGGEVVVGLTFGRA